MAIWIGLLRGINVGGKNKIKMAELRTQLETAGLENVATYIQSGNLVFSSSLTARKLETLIHDVIAETWSYDVPTVVMKASELKKLAAANPLADRDPKMLHLTLLDKKPTATAIKRIAEFETGDDEFIIAGRCVYVNCPNGYSRTKLTNGFFESKLNCRATTRNWRTVNKLIELSQ